MILFIILGYSVIVGIYAVIMTGLFGSLKKRLILAHYKPYKDDLILLGITLGFVLGSILSVLFSSLGIINFELPDEDYRLLVSTNGTIIATVFAISFSISILGIQHALGNFAPSLLKHFVTDKTTITCFGMLSFSAVINLFGLVVPWKTEMASLSLYLLPYSFGLIAYYYYVRSRKTNSVSLLKILEKDCLRYLKRHSSRSSLKPIEDSARDVIGLIHRSLSLNDHETVEYGLDTLCNIIQNYVKVKNPIPDDELISSVYSMINSITTVAIEKKSQQILNKIVLTYEKIGTITTEMPSLRNFAYNQSTGLAIYHLNELFNLLRPFGDVHLQVINSMWNVAVHSIQNLGDDALTIQLFSEIASNLEGIRNYLVFRKIMVGIVRIVNSYILAGLSEIPLSRHIEGMTEISIQILNSLRGRNAEDVLSPLLDNFELGFPNSVSMMAINLCNLSKSTEDEYLSKTFERHAFDIIPKLNNCLIKISSSALAHRYVRILELASQSLSKISIMFLKEEFKLQLSPDQEIGRVVKSISNIFMGFFHTNDDLDYGLFDELLDILTLIGLNCVKLKKSDLVYRVADHLVNLAFNVAKFDDYGFHPGRIADRLQLIGLYADNVHSNQISLYISESLSRYDSEIREIPIIESRSSIESLENEVRNYDPLFDLDEVSPKKFLKENLFTNI